MQLFNNIIWWINIAIIIIFGFCFLFQLLFMLLFFIKPRKYKHSDNLKHFTFIIRAHNEEDVIRDSVTSCLNVDYPKDKFNVVVFAHNCNDNTIKIAKECGAIVIEINDPDPKHAKASYCMWHGMNALKAQNYKTDYFLLIDADNQVHKNYIRACNDAANENVKLGRTFENSKNLTDNMISCMSGLWYLRDSRVACGIRGKLNLGSVMNGCCSMIKAEYAFNWDAMSTCDDIEFTLNRLVKDGEKADYIDDAILYEDQPSTLEDVFNRNTRMSGGLNKLYFSTGLKCLALFFKNLFNPHMSLGLKMTYLDQYLNIAIVPGSVIACIWFPLYYIYTLIYVGITGPITIWGLGSFGLMWFIWFIVGVMAGIIIIPFWFQPAFACLSCKDKLIIKNKNILIKSIIFCPAFMLVQAYSILKGAFMKSKWKKIKRSTTKIEQ